MKKINFEAGTQVSPAKVIVNETEYSVTPAKWEGNTPLSPHTLNLLQDNIEKSCVTVSPTQPTTNESVWIRKGNNEFDKNNSSNFLNAGMAGQANAQTNITAGTTDTTRKSIIFRCEPNQTYTISTNGTHNTFSYAFFESMPKVGDTCIKIAPFGTEGEINFSSYTLTTENTTNYILFYLDVNNLNSLTSCEIMINKGATVLPYEEYVEEKILIKNNAGEFEEYSDVVVSPVRPVQGKVWIKTGKNLVNKNALQQII